jgi:hypothetical protein
MTIGSDTTAPPKNWIASFATGFTSEFKNPFSPACFLLFLSGFLFAAYPKEILGINTFFYRDYGVLGYPFVFYHQECFWRGELPLWNPLSNCGAPFLAQWGTMTLYPFSILYLLLPLPWSLNLFCFLHLLWGGFGMYRLASRWVNPRFAATAAGFTYILNGVTLSCLVWPNYVVALGWLPWVVLMVERGWKSGGRFLILGALASTMQLLSGVPEIVLFTWLLIGCLFLVDVFQNPPQRPRFICRLGGLILLSAGLASIQLLPFFDLLMHSQRDRNFASSKWAMPGWGWANFLVPMFHYFETPQGMYFQFGQAFLSSYYLGLITVVISAWVVLTTRRRPVWILAGLSLFSLIMAMGDHGLVLIWFRKLFPWLGVARYPVKFTILIGAVVPLLLALGVTELDRKSERREPVWPTLGPLVGIILLLMFGILWFAKAHPYPYDQWDLTWKNALVRILFLVTALIVIRFAFNARSEKARSLSRMGLLFLLGIDVLSHNPHQNPSLPSAIMTPKFWTEHQPSPAPSPGVSRVMISQLAERHLLRSTVADWLSDWMGKRLALWSNLNLLDGIAKVNGSSTLQLRREMQVQGLLYNETNSASLGLMDFLGIAFVSSSNSVVEWSPRTSWLPLITTGQTPKFAGPDETLRALTSPKFNPRTTVYLPKEAQSEVLSSKRMTGRIVTQSFSPSRLDVTVEAENPSLLVIAQSYYHCWKGYVDGKKTRIWPANFAFQALQFGQGRHHIVIRYEDTAFHVGIVISAVSSLLALMLWILKE